jgi:DNA-binding LytR/AlgR family response regulator
MSRLKVAVLEDSKVLLKELIANLKATDLVQVVAFSTQAEEFIEKVKSSDVEALLLDIDLAGDSMSGLDVAAYLKMPVLFVSGKTPKYVHQIEEHNFSSEIPVEHVSKPATLDRLKRALPKFIQQVEQYVRQTSIRLDFADSKGNLIRLDDIVYVETEQGKGGESGNKLIHFRSRPPERLIDLSFPALERAGLAKHKFIQPHKSYRVNADQILSYDSTSHKIEVKSNNGKGMTSAPIPVSENYRKLVRSKIKSAS